MSKFIDTMINAIGQAIIWFYDSVWYIQLATVAILLFITFKIFIALREFFR